MLSSASCMCLMLRPALFADESSCPFLCAQPGHQLHFDSDDEGIGGVRNPIISTVVYLQAGTLNGSISKSSNPKESCSTNGEASRAAAAAGPQQSGAAEGTRGSLALQGGEGEAAAGQAVSAFIGGPTLMTDQLLGGTLARSGWLACPATNRLTMFDAKYLHGKLKHFHLSCR